MGKYKLNPITGELDIVGVESLKKTGSGDIYGTVTLSEGANITITQSGNDITISSSASGGQSMAKTFAFMGS